MKKMDSRNIKPQQIKSLGDQFSCSMLFLRARLCPMPIGRVISCALNTNEEMTNSETEETKQNKKKRKLDEMYKPNRIDTKNPKNQTKQMGKCINEMIQLIETN